MLSVVIVLSYGGSYVARQIPFAKEVEWTADIASHLPVTNPEMEAYLQSLAERLTARHPMPPGMQLRVHYDESDTVNAYATLGGHVVIYRGLLDVIDSENALAMVLAHEIAHIVERHPIESLGRTAGVSLMLAVINTAVGGGGVDVLSTASLLTMLKFSRDQESKSDAIALEMVAGLYGHVAGADAFFRQAMGPASVSGFAPEFLQTHPVHAGRVAALHALAKKHGWPREGALSELRVVDP